MVRRITTAWSTNTRIMVSNINAPLLNGPALVTTEPAYMRVFSNGWCSNELVYGTNKVWIGDNPRPLTVVIPDAPGPFDLWNLLTNSLFTNSQSPNAVWQLRSEKGQANGYASLDGNGKVPTNQLPAISGDVTMDQLNAVTVALTNLAYVIGANGTNYSLAVETALTSLAYFIGGNNTNYVNSRAVALSNLNYAIGANGTNYANAISVAASNLAYAVGANGTNYINSRAVAVSNLCYVIGLNGTNYANAVGLALTNLIAGLRADVLTNNYAGTAVFSGSVGIGALLGVHAVTWYDFQSAIIATDVDGISGALNFSDGFSYDGISRTLSLSSTLQDLSINGSNNATYVVGPGSATDNALARLDGTTGKLIKNSAATLDDSGVLTTAAGKFGSGGNITIADNGMGWDEIIGYNSAANAHTPIGFRVARPVAAAGLYNTTLFLATNNQGRVGILTENPLYPLDVRGDIHGSGSLFINGPIGVGDAGVASLQSTGNITAASNIIAPNMLTSNLINRAKGSWWANGGSNVQWRLARQITLTNVADVSACAYNPLTRTFWTIHNNNAGRITEWNLAGENVRVINGTGAQCPDAEAIVWLGDTRFAISDEDNGRIFVISITNNASGSSWSTNNSTIIQLNSSIGTDLNSGSGAEGIAWDPDRNGWWVAREKTPAQLLFCSADGQTTNNYFTTAQMQTFTNSTHTDFSDLYLDRENQLLWVTQDEGGTQTDRVLAISLLTSNVVHTINTTNFGQLEGVSVTPDGLLLLAGEVNQFAIYEPVYGGLNSGLSFNRNAQTNLPDTVQLPFGVTVGLSGALLTNMLYGTVTFDVPQVGAQTETNFVITVTGAARGDVVSLGVTNDNPGITFSARASNDTVHVRLHNYSASAVDVPSSVYSAAVLKFR